MIKYLLSHNASDCCGCRACEQICTHGAIFFTPDSEGFLYPQIDDNKCANCGLCEKVCPLGESKRTIHEIGKAYAFQLLDKESLLNSSSGGVFYAVSKYILSQKGVVYGSAFDGKYAKHKRIDKLDYLIDLMGSKYVQSDTGDTYTHVKKDLNNGVKVFYTGTPCQIAGLKLFLRKEYENLFTADLVCHGTPSPKILAETISHIEDRLHARFKCYSFRDKRVGGWSCSSSSSYELGKKIIYLKYSKEMEAYFNAFISGHLMRMNCYQCPFARLERPGDITIADYWGVEKLHPEFPNINKGMSLLISNSHKGDEILCQISKSNFAVEVDLLRAADNNHNLKTPTRYSIERKLSYTLFFSDYKGFLNKYFTENYLLNKFKAEVLYVIRNNEKLFCLASKLSHKLKK